MAQDVNGRPHATFATRGAVLHCGARKAVTNASTASNDVSGIPRLHAGFVSFVEHAVCSGLEIPSGLAQAKTTSERGSRFIPKRSNPGFKSILG